MGLVLSIQTGSTAPIYRQIIDQVRQAVIRRELVAGEMVPSVRGLAETLVINPNTVARAYTELVREGVLESMPAKGLVVAQRRQIYTRAERLRRVEGPLAAFVQEAVFLGFSPEDIHAMVDRQLNAMGGTKKEARP